MQTDKQRQALDWVRLFGPDFLDVSQETALSSSVFHRRCDHVRKETQFDPV
jgi:hypothetical protein